MRNLLIITWEDFKNLIKNPMWIFFATAYPVLLALILGYLTENAGGGNVSSYNYYGITMVIYGIISSGMTSANAFMEERIKKPNMRIIYAPGMESNIFLSKILASFGFSFLFHMIDLLFLHVVVGVRIAHVGKLVLLFGLTELFFITLGVMLCCILKTEMMTNQIQGIIVNTMALLGGVLFSLDSFGKIIGVFCSISPVKWLVNASFQTIYGFGSQTLVPVAGFFAAGTVIMTAVCFLTFKKEDCIC